MNLLRRLYGDIRRPDDPRHRPLGAWEGALLAAIVGFTLVEWTLRTIRFFAVVPGHDFLGDLEGVYSIVTNLREYGRLLEWNPKEAFGHPTTVQNGSILLFLPSAILTLLGVPLLVSAKIWFVVLHTASVLGLYRLAREYLPRAEAVVASCIYLLCPLHLREFSHFGHWQLATTYFWLPWLALSLRRARLMPNRGTVARSALWLVYALWTDNERTATAMPILAAWLVIEWALHPTRRGALAVVSSFFIAAAVCACFTLPVVLERPLLNLFRGAAGRVLWGDISAWYRIAHPFVLVDTGNWLFSSNQERPPHFDIPSNAQTHLGWAAAAGIALGLVLLVLHKKDERRLRLAVPLGLLGFTSWLAMGREQPWASWKALFASTTGLRLALAWILTALLVTAIVTAALGPPRSRVVARLLGVMGLGFGCVMVFIPARALLSALPVYAFMRNFTWFVAVNGPLLVALIVGLVLADPWCQQPRVRSLLLGACLALLVSDFAKPRDAQTHVAQRSLQADREVQAFLGRDKEAFRFLHAPCTSGVAHDAFVLTYSEKANANSWLLWADAQSGATALAEACNAADRALLGIVDGWASLAELRVKYLITSTPPTSGSVFQGAEAFVLKNPEWRTGSWVSTAASDSPVPFTRPRPEEFILSSPAPGSYRINEAFYPFWRVVPPSAARLSERSDGLMTLDVVRGGSDIHAIYTVPILYRALRIFSAAAILVLLALATSRRAASPLNP